jgi:hypothetical protein
VDVRSWSNGIKAIFRRDIRGITLAYQRQIG